MTTNNNYQTSSGGGGVCGSGTTTTTATTTRAYPHEILVAGSSTDTLVSVFDSRTGALHGSFKNNSSQAHALTLWPRPFAGGHVMSLLAAQSDKAFLHQWAWHAVSQLVPSLRACVPNSRLSHYLTCYHRSSLLNPTPTLTPTLQESVVQKYLCVERLTAIAVSGDGLFMAGGTAQGRLYFWDLLSGDLLRVCDVHYKRVTVIRFTADHHYLVTASEDAAAHVFLVGDFADTGLSASHDDQATPVPHRTFSEHTQPITDIRCGGAGANTRIWTSSLDRSAKVV